MHTNGGVSPGTHTMRMLSHFELSGDCPKLRPRILDAEELDQEFFLGGFDEECDFVQCVTDIGLPVENARYAWADLVYAQYRMEKIKPVFNLFTLLWLEGRAVGIISNTWKHYTSAFKVGSRWANLFSIGRRIPFIASNEYGSVKPQKLLFERAEEAAKQLGASNGPFVMIGNSAENDIKPAKALGWRTFLVGDADGIDGFRGDEPFLYDAIVEAVK